MKVLQWTKEGERKGEMFRVFNIRWDKRLREWVETSNPDARWGITHPDTGHILALKKRNLSYYGIVHDVEIIDENEGSADIKTQVVMGTPSLGVVADEEE